MLVRQSISSFLFCAVTAVSLRAVSGYTTFSTVANSRCDWGLRSYSSICPSPKHNVRYNSRRQVACSMSSTKPATGGDKGEEEPPLTPEKVAELIEVSFVKGVMQLAQGYVDVLKLFIAAVSSGYALGMTPGNLLDTVADCPEQSANRPLMDEEVTLRTTWIQVIYLVLDHVHYKDKNLGDLDLVNQRQDGRSDAIDATVQETYAGAIPIVLQAREDGASFEAEKILELCSTALPSSGNKDPLEKAILSQSLRVIWLALTVLEEEAQCLEDKAPFKPQPQIPGAFD